ncbi:IclR family transcriptional regulator C-terminal domain-containing protein [Bradyrhizobium sp. AS23.2]|uniref:IclR family transcriptional regulator n=1 Tax=Bradyrhizobium sp. AS23.2 TaxID=1680155 RepID=UPI000940210E|nr:IclR family transcriptional regulator C-terminal domain-containing protein [Bradyrhizobium sp. AS23.2]
MMRGTATQISSRGRLPHPAAPFKSANAFAKPAIRPMRGKRVGAVVNAFEILRHLDGEDTALRATEIARDLRINPSTCFNVLQTLVTEGAVGFDPAKKLYRLVDEWRQAISCIGTKAEVLTLKPEAECLARKHQSFITLWRRAASDRLVLVFSTDTPLPFEVRMPPGSRVPLFVGSAGRVMAVASGVSERELRASFERLRWDRPPPFEIYARELAAVRQKGWALDRENFARGFVTISAPVRDAAGQVRYACSATMPSFRWNETLSPAIAADLLELGHSLSRTATRSATPRCVTTRPEAYP